MVAAVLGTSWASAAVFDAVTGFSLTNNTATNRWSYWGTSNTNVSTYAANVALLPNLINNCGRPSTICWDDSTINNLVFENVTGVDAIFPNADARNNQLTYFNRTGVLDIRFLVPTTGSYSLSGFFEGSANAPAATRNLIVVNSNVGSPLFNLGPALDPFGTVNNFSFASLSFTAGDVVDFLLAGTPNADTNSLATGFNATFTQGTSGVPEPGTIGIIASGLALIAWKRHKLLVR